jgi:hypothetical protein
LRPTDGDGWRHARNDAGGDEAIVEGMGLDWKTQHRKIMAHPVLSKAGHYDYPFSGRPAGDGLPAASPAPRLADDDQRQQGVFGSARRIDPDAIGRILDRLQALEDGFDPTQGIVTMYGRC